MKSKIKYSISRFLPFTIFTIFSSISSLTAQDFEMRVIGDDFDYIAVQVRETSGTGLPTITTDILDVQFEIRWDTVYSLDLDVGLIYSEYKLLDGLGSRQEEDNFFWRVFAADSAPFSPKDDWIEDQWVTIGQFKAIEPFDEDTAAFAVAPDLWIIQGLNINIDGTDYSITPGDSLQEYKYPTLVYDYVWAGGAAPASGYDESSWTYGLNWENECRQKYNATEIPSNSNRCIIPGGLTYYPTNFNNYSEGFARILKNEQRSLSGDPLREEVMGKYGYDRKSGGRS